MTIRHPGNLLLLLFAVYSCAATPIELTVTDMNGRPIDQLSIGLAAMVQVTIHDANLELSTIEGLEKAVVQGPHVSRTMTIINGNRSEMVQYQYIVRFDQPGIYTIGPALGGKQASNACTLKVVEPQIEEDITKLLAGQEPCYAVLKSDKKEIMLGERCTITVALYYRQMVQLEQIANPVFEHCTVTPLAGKSSQEKVDNTLYYCLEQSYQITPEQVGSIMVPAIEVVVALPAQRRSWFGPRLSYQRIYSNPLKIMVNSLPDPNRTVYAVGQISSFNGTCTQTTIDLGQTAPISWTVEGDGGVVDARLPELQLPAGVKYYPGKNSLNSLADDHYEKIFEGVLQGVEPGSWTIESQLFTYFDTKTHKYKTVKSKKIEVTVVAPVQQKTDKKPPKKASDQPVKPHESSTPTPVQSDADPRLLTIWRTNDGGQSISWSIFITICLMIAGITVLLHMIRGWYYYRASYAPYYRVRFAYRRAQAQLNKWVRAQQIDQLYGTFMRYVADRLALPDAYVSTDFVKRALRERILDTQERETVATYIALLERAAFYTTTLTTEEKKYILQQATAMLRLLHKVTR